MGVNYGTGVRIGIGIRDGTGVRIGIGIRNGTRGMAALTLPVRVGTLLVWSMLLRRSLWKRQVQSQSTARQAKAAGEGVATNVIHRHIRILPGGH